MQRYNLGDEVAITVQCRDVDGTPAEPDIAPIVKIYDASGTVVETIKLPPKDRSGALGYFEHFVRLDDTYTTGTYSWRAEWISGGAAQVASDVLQIIGGTTTTDDGTLLSADFIDRGGSRHLIQHLSGNEYRFGHNPRL